MTKYTIGILSPLLDGYYFGNLHHVIHQHARKSGIRLVTVRTTDRHHHDVPLAFERADGWIVLRHGVSESYKAELLRTGKPVTMINQLSELGHFIQIDERSGIREATLHLINHGHRQIAFVGDTRYPFIQSRYEGYLEALRDGYGNDRPEPVVIAAEANYSAGIQAADRIIEMNFPCTAAIAASDAIAVGLIDRLIDRGYRIPEDLAVIGFDDIPPAASPHRSLTTMKMPFERIGEEAVDWIVQQIKQPDNNRNPIILDAELIVRSSCGCDRHSEKVIVHENVYSPKSEIKLFDYLEHILLANDEFMASHDLAATDGLDKLGAMLPPGIRWGLLALWETGSQAGTMLRVSNYLHRDQTLPQLDTIECLPGFFPPITKLSKPFVLGDDDTLTLVPVRSERRDWGVLALVGEHDIIRKYGNSDAMTHFINMVAFTLEREALIEQLRSREAVMTFLAYHDTLTGLPNRLFFAESLQKALDHAGRHRHKVALLLLDLDDFKMINDQYGHPIGDKMLKVVAERLQRALHLEHTIARFGGDEFVILLPYINNEEEAVSASRALLEALEQPYVDGDVTVSISGSLGISIYPRDGDDMESLYNRSDLAMYQAKTVVSGRKFALYNKDMNDIPIVNMELEHLLREGIDAGELVIYYQPQIEPATGKLFGAEALVRWKKGDVVLPPSEFIPLAERSELIVQIGQFVLRETCRQLAVWQAEGRSIARVSVNLSARELGESNFADTVLDIIGRAGLSTDQLCLEVTETAAVQDMEASILIFEQLKKHGIEIALDDFGTGYSSLVSLKRYPVGIVKIDRSFIAGMSHCSKDIEIVRAMISMVRSLGLAVIAEGVETSQQLDWLKQMNCDLVQGYLIDRPLPAEDFAAKYF